MSKEGKFQFRVQVIVPLLFVESRKLLCLSIFCVCVCVHKIISSDLSWALDQSTQIW